MLASRKNYGAVYRIISVFQTNQRRLLVDQGFVGLENTYDVSLAGDISLLGNLHWPDEVDTFTPTPDLKNNIWFARDVERIASLLGTEPVLLILKDSSPKDKNITPMPIISSNTTPKMSAIRISLNKYGSHFPYNEFKNLGLF